jgi:hypothetical protein
VTRIGGALWLIELLWVAVLGLSSPGLVGPETPATVVAGPTAVPASELGPELTVEIDEAALTTALDARLAGLWLGTTPLGSASVDAVAVGLRDDRLSVRGTALAGWTLLPLELTAAVAAGSGRALVQVDEGYAGGAVLPGAARRSVERTLQSELDHQVGRLGLEVRSVSIGPGRLVVVGRPAGRGDEGRCDCPPRE